MKILPHDNQRKPPMLFTILITYAVLLLVTLAIWQAFVQSGGQS